MLDLPLKTLNDFSPKLTHAGNFLNYLNLNELDTLVEFLADKHPEVAKNISDNKEYKFVYHGSPKKLKTVKPAISKGGQNQNKDKSLIYATTLPDYALFMSCINQKSNSSATVKQQGQYLVQELIVGDDFVNGESSFDKGYVYIFSSRNFKVQSNNLSEWYADKSTNPLFAIRAYITDIRTPIKVEHLNH